MSFEFSISLFNRTNNFPPIKCLQILTARVNVQAAYYEVLNNGLRKYSFTCCFTSVLFGSHLRLSPIIHDVSPHALFAFFHSSYLFVLFYSKKSVVYSTLVIRFLLSIIILSWLGSFLLISLY